MYNYAETNAKLRGHAFYPPAAELATIPDIYEQDGKGLDAVVHVHYFAGGADWYVTEIDKAPDNPQAFGYVWLYGYPEGELGYIWLPELEALRLRPLPLWVERDLYWELKPLREVIAEREKREDAAREALRRRVQERAAQQ